MLKGMIKAVEESGERTGEGGNGGAGDRSTDRVSRALLWDRRESRDVRADRGAERSGGMGQRRGAGETSPVVL